MNLERKRENLEIKDNDQMPEPKGVNDLAEKFIVKILKSRNPEEKKRIRDTPKVLMLLK